MSVKATYRSITMMGETHRVRGYMFKDSQRVNDTGQPMHDFVYSCRPEEMYALMCPDWKGKHIFVFWPDDWQDARTNDRLAVVERTAQLPTRDCVLLEEYMDDEGRMRVRPRK